MKFLFIAQLLICSFENILKIISYSMSFLNTDFALGIFLWKCSFLGLFIS